MTRSASLKNAMLLSAALIVGRAGGQTLFDIQTQNINAEVRVAAEPDAIPVHKTTFFQLLSFEREPAQRQTMRKLHNTIGPLMQNKTHILYSQDNTKQTADLKEFITTINSTLKQNPDAFPVMELSGHGATKKVPHHVGCNDGVDIDDTILVNHYFQCGLDSANPEHTLMKDSVLYPDLLMTSDLLLKTTSLVMTKPGVVIFDACYGGRAAPSAGYFPLWTEMLMLASARDVVWDYRAATDSAVGRDPMVDLATHSHVITSYLKHMNDRAKPDTLNLAVIGIVTAEKGEDTIPHKVRVIALENELPQLAQRYGTRALGKAGKTLSSQFKAADLNSAVAILTDSARIAAPRTAFVTADGKTLNGAVLGAAMAIGYTLCRRHLKDMPFAEDYEEKTAFIPAARRGGLAYR